MKKLKIVSLFSGIGAFEKALSNLKINFEVINYCEIDKYSSFAYSVIHDIEETKNLGDITKVDSTKLKDFDLLTYGFPCQDISLAGKMAGIIKGQTRSGLLYEALNIIKNKKPKFAIAENVKNLVSKRFEKDFQGMIKELDELGYNSYWSVLNSKDYGSVQSRERVFIISIRKDVDTKKFKFPSGSACKTSLKDIREQNIDEKYYCKNDAIKEFISSIDRKLIVKDNPQSGLKRLEDIKNKHALDMNNRVFANESLVPTILTKSDSIPKVMEYRVRKLTPLECWRATGFDDYDYFKVKKALQERFYNGQDKGDSQLYRMAGNSIVVQVLENIFKELLEVK